MKLKLFIILLSISLPLAAQHTKSNLDFHVKDYSKAANFNPKSAMKSGSISVIPSVSKYPVSNFITDIFRSGDTVWFATGSGIMRTVDRFGSFQSYYGLEPFGKDDISGLAIKDNVIAVATATSQEINGESVAVGTGIKISTDNGASWSAYPQPLDGLYDTTLVYGSNTIHCLPVVVPQQNLAYDIAITRTKGDLSNYTIWISTFAGGVRKTTDYGATWQRVLLPSDLLDSIYIGGTGYTYNLNPNQNLNHRAFTIEADNDSVLYAGTANGINRSTDWGVSWRKFNFQNSGFGTNRVSGNFVVNLYVQNFPGYKVLWAATRKAEGKDEFNAYSYTTNGGITWSNTLRDINPYNISSYNNIVYLQTDAGLWRGVFGVLDWVSAPTIFDKTTNDYLKTSSFYSGNNLGDTLYFGTQDGLVRTLETGSPWASDWRIIRAIKTIDLSSDKKTYAAPNPFAPADENVRIFFKTGKAASKVTIKLFDFGMNPVRTVLQNAVRNSADELFAIWDGKNNEGFQVPNGVYFYRIEIDDDTPVWGKILVIQ